MRCAATSRPQTANQQNVDRVVIRSLGPAEGGPVNPGARTKLVLLAFVVGSVSASALYRLPRSPTGGDVAPAPAPATPPAKPSGRTNSGCA